jgi:DNA-binding CsgD family transcriptional regulator
MSQIRARRRPAKKAKPRRAAEDSIVRANRLLALFEAKDLEALIDAVFGVMKGIVKCDFATAFYRSSPKGLLKARDSRGREYGAQFMRRHVELNPAIPLALANRGIKILPTRMGLPHADDELRSTPFYREIMQPLGWRHSVALCFWGDPPEKLPVFVTSADRREGRSDFSDQDIAMFERIHPFLDCAVNRLYEQEKAKSVRDGMAITGRGGSRGLAVLDWNLRLVEANSVARRLSATWGDGVRAKRAGHSRVPWATPPLLARECREMRHEWESLLLANPDAIALRRRPHIPHPRDRALTASITMVCRNTTGLSEPSFVLEFARRMPQAAVQTRRAEPVLQSLTGAERAVAMVLAEGVSNQEIADRLEKSVDAVKFLLHRINKKTGVPSRAALVATLRG